ncbi:MAG: uroporphyrinogen-III synthase [Acidobacteriaceae bacterium]
MTDKPLSGRRILITRARGQASQLATALEELGAETIVIPAIEIAPPDSFDRMDQALHRIEEFSWIIFTSANAVPPFLERMKVVGLSAKALSQVKIAAIGPSTAREIEQAGLTVALMPPIYVAESLVESLRTQVRGSRVLLVRAKVARDLIPEELAHAGAAVEIVEAYQNILPQDSIEEMHRIFHEEKLLPDAVTFTSSSTARNFFVLASEAGIPKLPESVVLASIGPVTSATLGELGYEPHVEATESTIAGLALALARYFRA